MEKRVSSLSQGQRILAAIMITDAVGFSKRMSIDEGLTLSLIDRDLTLIAETCSDYGGTVLKSTGDGLLIYFVSAVEAVSCGLDIQQKLVELANNTSGHQYLDHRIGIHLGDILVSEQDVMGNGVNITARLQTYAKPRGICVSQTIYDVVKARLELNSTFLGPLQLKNIQEPVSAYQISLVPKGEQADSDPSVVDESTCTLPMSTDVLLDIATRTLLTHSDSQRIKKLVFAVDHQAWENDTRILEQFDLRALLTSLRERYPNLNELEYQFRCVVMGLNRQALYQNIAAIILESLQPWYARSITPITKADTLKPAVTPEQSLSQQLQQVAEQLLQNQVHELRIRKLLYCLSQHRWENEAEVLYRFDLVRLIHQSLQVAPHRKDLRYHLGRIIKRINRRKTYTQVGNEIIAAFQPLYDHEAQASNQNSGGYKTQISDSGGCLRNNPPVEDVRLSSPSLMDDDSNANHTAETCLGLSSNRDENHDLTTLHSSLSEPITVQNHASSAENQRPTRSRETLFDLRLAILQYANPLRTKILLHSCLHGPFSYTNQDWYSLRQYTLDDLLKETFGYCPTFSDLDSKLMIIAHCLDPHDENAQIASVIAQAMKAYYPEDPDSPLDPVDVREADPDISLKVASAPSAGSSPVPRLTANAMPSALSPT